MINYTSNGQISLYPEIMPEVPEQIEKKNIELFPLDEYDKLIISESAGKDSMTILFQLLELGIDRSKIELWHQSVDGMFQDRVELFDWPVTESYIDAVGKHFGIKVSYQWREGGIYNELMRKDSLTGSVYYINNDGEIVKLPTKNGKESTRRKFPALSANLSVRWCSAYNKIDVFRRVLNNHPDYQGTKDNPMKILVFTGERREESYARSKYNEFELHSSNSQKRIVHTWRSVIDFKERDIWDYYEKFKILPHMAYLLGFSRTSCLSCIFMNSDLWRMYQEIVPDRFDYLVRLERELNHTIDPKMTLEEKASKGSLKRFPKDARLSKWVEMALSRSFRPEDLIMDKFELPAGAFLGAAGGSI